MVECSEVGKHAMFSPVHVRSTLIGEKVFPSGKTEGFCGKNQRCCFDKLAEKRFAAVGQPLRLAGSPLPLSRADARHRGRHYVFAFLLTVKRGIIHRDRETLQRFRLLYDAQLHCIEQHAYIAAVVTTQRKTFAGSGWWFRVEN